MKTIYWSFTQGVADNQAKRVAEELLEYDHILSGNYLVFDYARILLLEGKIDGLQVKIDGETFVLNEYGVNHELSDKIYCDVASRLLKLQVEKKRENRKK